jgi:hypothetical protein
LTDLQPAGSACLFRVLQQGSKHGCKAGESKTKET